MSANEPAKGGLSGIAIFGLIIGGLILAIFVIFMTALILTPKSQTATPMQPPATNSTSPYISVVSTGTNPDGTPSYTAGQPATTATTPTTTPTPTVTTPTTPTTVTKTIKPKQATIADCGLPDKPHGYYDMIGQGVKNDYCRYVLVPGSTLSTFMCAFAGETGNRPYASSQQYNARVAGVKPEACWQAGKA